MLHYNRRQHTAYVHHDPKNAHASIRLPTVVHPMQKLQKVKVYACLCMQL